MYVKKSVCKSVCNLKFSLKCGILFNVNPQDLYSSISGIKVENGTMHTKHSIAIHIFFPNAESHAWFSLTAIRV